MRAIGIFFASVLCAGGVQAASGVTAAGVVLLQPERVIEARIGVDKLAPYLKQVDALATRSFKAANAMPPSGGFLVVAIRPGGQSRCWLDFDPPLPQALASALISGVQAVRVPAMQAGTVVIAMKYGLAGGSAPARPMPSPAEWTTHAKAAGKPLEIGDLVDRIWK